MKIISRETWGAQQPLMVPQRVTWQGKAPILHHTAHRRPVGNTRRELMADERRVMRELQQIAFARGYSDISYNHVVMPSGRVYQGRGSQVKGAHTQGGKPGCRPFYNDHPGISLPGDYTHTAPTRAQRVAVYRLRRRLRKRTGSLMRMVPHRAVFWTACPGDATCEMYGFTGAERP